MDLIFAATLFLIDTRRWKLYYRRGFIRPLPSLMVPISGHNLFPFLGHLFHRAWKWWRRSLCMPHVNTFKLVLIEASPTVASWLDFLSRHIMYRSADRCVWSIAWRQGRMMRAKSLHWNFVWEHVDLLTLFMLLHICLRIHHWLNLLELSFCVRMSELNHSASNCRTLKKCHQFEEAGTFFCLRAGQYQKGFLLFPIYLPIEEAYPTKQRHRYCDTVV